jgi:uncharacterized membrane protein
MPLLRTLGRLVLGAFLVFAGVAHLTFGRQDFRAQVPSWFTLDVELTVVASGVVEVVLGLAFLLLPRHRRVLGLVLALFFVAVFPGNVAQYVEHRDAFGLDTDRARLIRLFFQPVLVAWALWAGQTLRRGSDDRTDGWQRRAGDRR